LVDWEYAESAIKVIKDLRLMIKDLKVVAVEQNEKSVSYNKYEYKLPLALIVGNESYGVLPKTLKECDGVLELPMFGVNISLNVMVSLAVVLYKVVELVN
jgi:23S rRNA (guanosine2251-2'-O)-methyltransferase